MKKPSYYQRNKHLWKPGGKYYRYKPKVSTGSIYYKTGNFFGSLRLETSDLFLFLSKV